LLCYFSQFSFYGISLGFIESPVSKVNVGWLLYFCCFFKLIHFNFIIKTFFSWFYFNFIFSAMKIRIPYVHLNFYIHYFYYFHRQIMTFVFYLRKKKSNKHVFLISQRSLSRITKKKLEIEIKKLFSKGKLNHKVFPSRKKYKDNTCRMLLIWFLIEIASIYNVDSRYPCIKN